jgi:hypothetical protein
MAAAHIDELDLFRSYANSFRHDSNPAWQTEAINDRELANFSRRTIRFASRP